MNTITFSQFVRIGARRLLDMIAWDKSLGVSGGWDEVKRIESRFALRGYTINKVCQYDDERKLYKALATIGARRWGEQTEIARMCLATAKTDLADLERARGRQWIECRAPGFQDVKN